MIRTLFVFSSLLLAVGCTGGGGGKGGSDRPSGVVWLDGTWLTDLQAVFTNPDGTKEDYSYEGVPIVVDQREDAAVFWGLGADVGEDDAVVFADYETTDLWTGYPKFVEAEGEANVHGADVHVKVEIDTGSGDEPFRYEIEWTIIRLDDGSGFAPSSRRPAPLFDDVIGIVIEQGADLPTGLRL